MELRQNSPLIESWWIEKYECGIYLLLFNTTERWIPFHQANDETYFFGEEPEDEEPVDYLKRLYEVPEFLPQDKMYIPTVIQNKDQISFYFIPFDLLWEKGTLINKSE